MGSLFRSQFRVREADLTRLRALVTSVGSLIFCVIFYFKNVVPIH